ncbi:6390_t:CDS:10 [Gigaspora margarita]|uniref:6390_t:CDS:1 n=1 Tax=Gigaspora margarita TaxID=4874 RepID=A0ABN7UHV2_GIGMA|nr:6390_t:CDS:10 [Gigaspora margarita]
MVALNFIIRIFLTISILLSIANAQKAIFIDPNDPWQVFEGWGTMLSWWANVIGGFPDDYKNLTADLVFDPEKEEITQLTTTLDLKEMCQVIGHALYVILIEVLMNIKDGLYLVSSLERGANIFEANSASPPYWMTKSNCSSGCVDGTSDNLDPSYYDAFAKYLTEVADNLLAKGLNDTSISIADENTIDQEVFTVSTVLLNHIQRTELFNITKQNGKKLWMSEYGLATTLDISASITLSEQILNDMRNLKTNAWVYLQATQDDPSGSNRWGLVGVSYTNSSYPPKIHHDFYAYKQYTKFIHPGYQIISFDDNDTLAAYSVKDQKLVIVCTNKGAAQLWNFNVNMFNISNITAFHTSNNETITPLLNIPPINNGSLVYLHPSDSITTLVFDAIPNL